MGEINCPQCGISLPQGAKFCHVCGCKIPEVPNPNTDINPNESQSANDNDFNVKDFTDIKSDEVIFGIKSGNIFKRAINIMFKPKSEWDAVAKETPRIPMLIFGYALIFSIITVVSMLIGYGLVGRRFHSIFGGFTWHRDFYSGTIESIVFILGAFTAIIVGALIINILAPAFKSEKNFGRALQLTTYSFTPVFFAGALYVLPFLSVLANLTGLYGIFVLLMGLPVMMKTPKNSQIGYFFASAGILFGIYYTVTWTTSAILFAIFSAIISF